MSEYIQKISFEQARMIAEETALRELERYMDDSSTIPVLREQFEEAECCWFFFRNKKIEGPPNEKALGWGWAYAVSKKGHVRFITDFSDEPEKLQEYLQVMSNHFKERGF